jgi:hypothetical protein
MLSILIVLLSEPRRASFLDIGQTIGACVQRCHPQVHL